MEGLFYDPAYAGYVDRDYAIATRTMRGGTAFGIYPFNRYRRVELYGGFIELSRSSTTTRPSPTRQSSTR